MIRQRFVDKNAPALTQIASEVQRLSPADGASRLHVEKLLREMAQAESTPEALRDLAWQALLMTQRVLRSRNGEGSLQQLHELVEHMLRAESAAPPASACKPRDFVMPSEIDPGLMREFCAESADHIQRSEAALMALESDPGDEESVNVLFRAFHTIKGVAGFVGISCVTELAHKAETFFDRFRKGTLVMRGPYTDLAFEALDMLKVLLGGLSDGVAAGRMRLPETYDDLVRRLENAEQLQEEGVVPAAHPSEGKAGEIPVRDGERQGTVKISTARLDNLINLVSELAIAQAVVGRDPCVRDGANPRLVRSLSQLDEITRSLQEVALSMRMVSVKATFQKMARLVRDLARKSRKEILFQTEGEETELDRHMVEAIADPLVHMVRNAADHGIEPPEERERAGKARAGRILLRAAHEDGSVVITLRDDGRGLDRHKIQGKAVERGLAKTGVPLSDQQIHRLLFMPGFTTADNVTDVSGRGVGLDVVRTNVEALRGSVEILSKDGQGCVFSIRLPLTLTVIDGRVIRLGE